MAHQYVAIDPLALLLSPSVYVRLTLPDPPPPDVLAKEIALLVHGMDATEIRVATVRVKALRGYVESMEKALAAHQ
jgi:hypothetical protein